MKDYRNLDLYYRSKALVTRVFTICQQCSCDTLATQLQRTTLAIPFSIAEGCTDGERRWFLQNLQTALSQVHALKPCLLQAVKDGHVSNSVYWHMSKDLEEVEDMLVAQIMELEPLIAADDQRKVV